MGIQFKKVTWYSQLFAIIIFVGVFYLGFYLGGKYNCPDNEITFDVPSNAIVATFTCDDNKIIQTEFLNDTVSLDLSDGRSMILPQVISGSGARFANSDESFVFWNKGNTAFIQENGETTYQNCVED